MNFSAIFDGHAFGAHSGKCEYDMRGLLNLEANQYLSAAWHRSISRRLRDGTHQMPAAISSLATAADSEAGGIVL